MSEGLRREEGGTKVHMLCNSIPVNQRLMVQTIILELGPQIVLKQEKV